MAVSTGRHAGGGFDVKVSEDGVTYATIGEVVDAQPPEWLVKEAKATHSASPDNMTETKPGLGDTSKGMVTLNFTENELEAMLALFRVLRYWRITYPLDTGQSNPARIDWRGYWTKLGGMKQDPDDANLIQVSVEFTRSSGKPTFTKGT